MSHPEEPGALPPNSPPGGSDVVLVSMPFGPLLQPSVGLGLLKASLAPHGLSCTALYFTLRFAELIGTVAYERIANGGVPILDIAGEWIFAGALFDAGSEALVRYVEDILHHRAPAYRGRKPLAPEHIGELVAARQHAEAFLTECVKRVLSHRPRVIGLTSTFQQHVASLALARKLKAAMPEIPILLGGANCEGVMGIETARRFPFVDAIVSGEGEQLFPSLVKRALEGKSFQGMTGVYTRDHLPPSEPPGGYANAPTVPEMDQLPVPDYTDFFQQWSQHTLEGNPQPRLLFESSRGCWWGERHHCTFCGLNGGTMRFRSKSTGRVLEELSQLSSSYPKGPILAVDNIIDMKYFKELLPELRARKLHLELIYEVKSNLRKDQVQLLKEAGVTTIQPGIESLSTPVLALMRKGVTGLQNVQLLKWCREFGLTTYWNFLWGFPREPASEYARLAEVVPHLTHLPPPLSLATIRMDRFSPNFDQAEQLGFVNVEPSPAYQHIFPFPPEVVRNLAYHFTFDYREPQNVASYTRNVALQLHQWRLVHEKSALWLSDSTDGLLIEDSRPAASAPRYVLRGAQRNLYLACDGISSLARLRQLLAEQPATGAAAPSVEGLLEPLLAQGVMLREGDHFLSLAVPRPAAAG